MRALTTAFCAIAILAVTAGATCAGVIPVPNGDFELGNTSWTPNTAGTQTLPYQNMDTTGHGNRILWINGSGNVWQVIPNYYVAANTTYKYSVDVGKLGDNPEYYSTPHSLDVAGYSGNNWVSLGTGTVLANAEPAAGQWSTWVKTTDANPAALGMPLAVHIVGGGGVQTLFDNVKLTTIIDVADSRNVLAGATVVASSVSGTRPTSWITDTLASDRYGDDDAFIFASSDPQQRLAFYGFTGRFDTLRYFTASEAQRTPTQVHVKSSTSNLQGSLVATGYETDLGTYLISDWVKTEYDGPSRLLYEIPLAAAAPPGTQSLFVNFGHHGYGAGIRVYEFQAVPEPGSIILLAAGVLGLLVCRRRR